MWLANTTSRLSSPLTSDTTTSSAPLVGRFAGVTWKLPPLTPQNTEEKMSTKPPDMLLAKTRSFHPFSSMSPAATPLAPLVGRLLSGDEPLKPLAF
jgi:hypothetical protein